MANMYFLGYLKKINLIIMIFKKWDYKYPVCNPKERTLRIVEGHIY